MSFSVFKEADFKTSNINLRVTPSFKKAVERRARQLHFPTLSDYVFWAIEQLERGAESAEFEAVRHKLEAAEARVAAFEAAAAPAFEKAKSLTLHSNGQPILVDDAVVVVRLLAAHLKIAQK